MAIRILGKASLASGLCVGALAVSCTAPRYTKFYERYVGTCEKTPAGAQLTAASSPRLPAIQAAFIRTLDEHEAEVRQCYSDALRYGETHGVIRLALALEPDGRADPVTVSADSTNFAPLACCVVSAVKSLNFGPTGEAGRVAFEYPFSFRTLRMPDASNVVGAHWFKSSATKTGFAVELDESSVVIGGAMFYPVASDGFHHSTDEDAGVPSKP